MRYPRVHWCLVARSRQHAFFRWVGQRLLDWASLAPRCYLNAFRLSEHDDGDGAGTVALLLRIQKTLTDVGPAQFQFLEVRRKDACSVVFVRGCFLCLCVVCVFVCVFVCV